MDFYEVLLAKKLSGGSGGGGTNMELVYTGDLGTIVNDTGSAVYTNKDIAIADISKYDLLLCLFVSDSSVSGTNKMTITAIMLNGTDTSKTTCHTISRNIQYVNGTPLTSNYNASSIGVYPDNATISGTSITAKVYAKNSAITGNIDGKYTAYIYGVNIFTLL